MCAKLFKFLIIALLAIQLNAESLEVSNDEEVALKIVEKLTPVILAKLKTKAITIADFNDIDGNTITEGKILAEELVANFSKNSNIKIIERKEIGKVLKEQEFNIAGLTELSNSQQVFKVLKAEGIICGTIASLSNSKKVCARLIDANSGKIIDSVFLNVKKITLPEERHDISQDLKIKLNDERANLELEKRREPELFALKLKYREELLKLQEENPEKFFKVIKTIRIIERLKENNPRLFLLVTEPPDSPKIKRLKDKNPELFEKVKELRKELKFITEHSPYYFKKLLRERIIIERELSR